MTNDVTKENLQFLINSRLSHDDKYGDIVFEVPAQHPGEKPLSSMIHFLLIIHLELVFFLNEGQHKSVISLVQYNQFSAHIPS